MNLVALQPLWLGINPSDSRQFQTVTFHVVAEEYPHLHTSS